MENIQVQRQLSEKIYSPDEMASYRKFAHKTQTLSDAELFKVNNSLVPDQLTSEMKDIVAWEIRIREIETLKRNGIDPSKEFSYKEANKEVHYDKDMVTKDKVSKYVITELQLTDEMSDDLLKKSMKIIEEHPRVIEEGEDLNNKNGGGINIMTKKFLVKCKNGETIEFDNKAIQEHFRKEYIKRMSEVTGINYSQYDLGQGSEIYGGYEDENAKRPDKIDLNNTDIDSEDKIQFNANDFEDD